MMKRPANMSRIRSFFERWERLETERRNRSEDLKELFKEAKGEGFNSKALRVAFADKFRTENEPEGKREVREADEADVDLYLAALAGPSHACEADRLETLIEQSGGIGAALSAALGVEVEMVREDPETGEITEQPEADFKSDDDGLAGPACARDDEAANTKPAPHSPAPSSSPAQAKADDVTVPSASSATNSEPAHSRRAIREAGAPVAAASRLSSEPFDIGDIPEFLRRSDGYPKHGGASA